MGQHEPPVEERLREIRHTLRHLPRDVPTAHFVAANMALELLDEVERLRGLFSEEDAERLDSIAEMESVEGSRFLRELADRIREVQP